MTKEGALMSSSCFTSEVMGANNEEEQEDITSSLYSLLMDSTLTDSLLFPALLS